MKNNFTKQSKAVIQNFRLAIILFSVFVAENSFAQSTTAIGTAKVWATVDGVEIEGVVQDPSAQVSDLQIACVFEYTEGDSFITAGAGIQEAIAAIKIKTSNRF